MATELQLLIQADQWVEAQPFIPIATLRAMCESKTTMDRVKALRRMHKQSNRRNAASYFAIAEALINNRSNMVRWQALIAIGYLIEYVPDDVWRIIREYGPPGDQDMRTALGVLLLEHLLDHDFDRYFPRVQRSIRRSDASMLDILSVSWTDAAHPERQERIRKLLGTCR